MNILTAGRNDGNQVGNRLSVELVLQRNAETSIKPTRVLLFEHPEPGEDTT